MRGHIAVAVSGGRDSTALMHCVAQAAVGTGVQVHALHVHHGLMAEADAWVAHLRRQVAAWCRRGLPLHLHVHRLATRPAAGESIEAWARQQRYAALTTMAHEAGVGTVLLAHHQDDQAETFLLQALRGAGAAGLSAMPSRAERAGIVWMRPWLAHPRTAIDAYLRRYRLSYIDDASNEDPRFARSRLRRQVWPALQAAFPDAAGSLALAARRAQENQACLAELSAIDLQRCVIAGRLQVALWKTLSEARRALTLRAWLAARGHAPVSDTLVQRLLIELPTASAASWPWQHHSLRLYRGQLQVMAPQPAMPNLTIEPEPITIDLSRLGAHRVEAWRGSLVVERATGPGLPLAALARAECRGRRGGERFQPRPGSLPRSLKKQYQAAGIPEWQRQGPLVYLTGELAFVPGLGLDARRCVAAAEGVCTVRWEPDQAAD
jgi:tRNA(Ile)-lysidine synthase